MDITLSYGKTGLNISIDDSLAPVVFRKKAMPVLKDADAAVSAALESPAGASRLRNIARGKHTACIIINDITRPVPNKLILPHLIAELNAAGLADENICLLNATGTHRPADRAEQVELVGEDILARHPFYNHDCFNDAEHRHIGGTAAGTPVYLDTRAMDADVKILTGLIEPHFMAGYSGGRKALCPGVASIKTVQAIHHPIFMEAENSDNVIVSGNPLHRELTEISRMAEVDFILNVVIDEERRVCGVFCGDVEAAHDAGVAFARQFDTVPSPQLFDIVITTSAGYPLDKTYYQTVKGLCGVTGILKPGGSMIIASACSEGMGNDTFLECLRVRARFGNHDEYIRHIEKREHFVPDQWQVEKLSQAMRIGSVYLVSDGLSKADSELTLVNRADSVEAALAACLQIHGPSAKIAVVPEGPYVIPFHQGA